jgi:diaminopimelate epimerase
MNIPYTKAHGAQNDFLLTWAEQAPATGLDEVARAICHRHTGVGADGWMLMRRGDGDFHAAIQLYNSDGSMSEISGNGTRCVAAFLVNAGLAPEQVRIQTGAGLKSLRLTRRDNLAFTFEMNMGRPEYNADELCSTLAVCGTEFDVTILNVGNPQCAVFVKDFELDWRAAGAEMERHQRFPNRTNVSFVLPRDRHTIDVRFWERGAGETMSSGTGSTGAAFAALARGLAEAPMRVETPAGALDFRLEDNSGYLTGPAELVAVGEYFTRS